MQPDMNGPAQFWKVPIHISEKEFNVAAKDLIVFLREVPLRAVRLQVFGAEHSDRPLKLGTAQGKIKSDHQQKSRFP
jgi:hypothetical protein